MSEIKNTSGAYIIMIPKCLEIFCPSGKKLQFFDIIFWNGNISLSFGDTSSFELFNMCFSDQGSSFKIISKFSNPFDAEVNRMKSNYFYCNLLFKDDCLEKLDFAVIIKNEFGVCIRTAKISDGLLSLKYYDSSRTKKLIDREIAGGDNLFVLSENALYNLNDCEEIIPEEEQQGVLDVSNMSADEILAMIMEYYNNPETFDIDIKKCHAYRKTKEQGQ